VIQRREDPRLQSILDRAVKGDPPDAEAIHFLLSLTDRERQDRLFAAAREIRGRYFGTEVFLYGFLYFSTFCRNDCQFCHYRRSNTDLRRYRKTPAQIMDTAEELKAAGVHLVDLTMGEADSGGVEILGITPSLADLVRMLKARCGLPVMISPGVVSDAVLRALAATGTDWYACYQETHNPRLFARMRTDQDFETRMEKKIAAKALGMLIEEGLMIGIGETTEDVTHSILAMKAIDADQVRVMTFVPQEGTPMANRKTAPAARESVVIAVLRLVFQDRLIPASLDVEGLDGLEERLSAGANVVTSLVVPGKGLAGVANKSLDIEQARRTPDAIDPILKRIGLTVASLEAYRRWIDRRRLEGMAKAV
jgi:methylornithine synthase